MYAVIEAGGKQYKVAPEQLVSIEQLDGEVGAKVTFDKVLAVGNEGGDIQAVKAELKNAKVEAKIVEHFRGEKIVVFKMKRRKDYRKKNGHRAQFTEVSIKSVIA